jgi:hypothetical protein
LTNIALLKSEKSLLFLSDFFFWCILSGAMIFEEEISDNQTDPNPKDNDKYQYISVIDYLNLSVGDRSQ